MVRQNPYYIDENLRIELRDSKGRYTTPSKAKYFYIYINGELVYSGDFPRVTLSIDKKDQIIADALNTVYIYDESLVPEDFEEDFEPIDEKALAKLLYEDLKKIVAQDLEELIEEIEYYDDFEELEEQKREELSDLLYKDLLDYISQEDPLLFEELTGHKVPIKGYFEDEYKDFESSAIGSASAQIFHFNLDKPIILSTTDPEVVVNIIKSQFLPAIKQAFDERIEGLNLFILSLIYTHNIKIRKGPDRGKIFESKRGMSIARFKAKTWKQFLFFMEWVYDMVRESYPKYLERSFDNKLMLQGFKLENLYSTTRH